MKWAPSGRPALLWHDFRRQRLLVREQLRPLAGLYVLRLFAEVIDIPARCGRQHEIVVIPNDSFSEDFR